MHNAGFNPDFSSFRIKYYFLGQHVVEEILDAQRPACPPEYINIEIPDNHSYRTNNYKEMPVLRTRYDERTGQSPNNPRQQVSYEQ